MFIKANKMKHLVLRINFSLFLLCTTAIFLSCNKEDYSKSLQEFYTLKVNNKLIKIQACGTSSFVAQYLKDTAVFAGFGCGGEGAGFYLKGQIPDGTYILDNRNISWYFYGASTYETDSLNTGILSIRSRIFELENGGHIPIVEGEFSFNAVDKNSGQKITVTNGKYLLRKYYF